MMQLVFYDQDSHRNSFFPLSLNRPLADLRIGILTFAERWAKTLDLDYRFITVQYLQGLYQGVYDVDSIPQSSFRPRPCQRRSLQSDHSETIETSFLVFYGLVLPSEDLVDEVEKLSMDEVIFLSTGNAWIWKTDPTTFEEYATEDLDTVLHQLMDQKQVRSVNFPAEKQTIGVIEKFLEHNGSAISYDFDLLRKSRDSHSLNDSNRIRGNQIFVEEGVTADYATFNTETGPIYLGKDAIIQEGAIIRGPFALGEGSQVKLGALVHSNVSIGPFCRISGELNTSVIWGYSNKGHHGYMGSSIIGAGCNWGAGSSNSNMKNSFGTIRIKDYHTGGFRDTGLRYLGVLMGDYSKSAIHVAFNSGFVMGVGCNQMATCMSSKFMANFTWMRMDQTLDEYHLESLISTLELYFQHLGYSWNRAAESEVLKAIQLMNG